MLHSQEGWGFFVSFSSVQICFTNTIMFFFLLREKSKWNSKLENGSGLKNVAMHLWFK